MALEFLKTSPTSPVARWTFSLIIGATIITGCGSSPKTGITLSFAPKHKIYTFPYESVWRATQLALAHYPIKLNNMDLGMLESDVIKGHQAWVPAHNPKRSSAGYRYRIIVKVIAGKSQKKQVTRVSITKKIEKQRDFFAKSEKIPSDGLEEQMLLYRIKRELTLERALKRYQERANN